MGSGGKAEAEVNGEGSWCGAEVTGVGNIPSEQRRIARRRQGDSGPRFVSLSQDPVGSQDKWKGMGYEIVEQEKGRYDSRRGPPNMPEMVHSQVWLRRRWFPGGML